MKKKISKIIAFLTTAIIFIVPACKKNYYEDGGLSHQSAAEMNMTAYDFMASRPNHMFDSLIKVINITNMKSVVNQTNITFYAMPNDGVLRLQQLLTPSDKQTPRPLTKIGVDTLKMLLNRLIVPGYKITLEKAVLDIQRYYKDNNADSLYIFGAHGQTGASGGVNVPVEGDKMTYQHQKIKGVDSIIYYTGIQTHNLVTSNAIIHVITYGSNFSTGLKLKYYR